MSGRELTVATIGDRDLVLTRTFDAPRPLLFDALTRPDLLVDWYGAQGWQLVECEVDLRVGGSWRFVSQGPGGEQMTQYGVYREVEPPERLVYTERFADQSFEGESLVTAVLDDRGGRSTLRSTVRFPSRQARDLVLSRPMERGLGQAYRRLDRLLSIRAPRRDRRATEVAARPRGGEAAATADADTTARST